jgi:hypothetical protein
MRSSNPSQHPLFGDVSTFPPSDDHMPDNVSQSLVRITGGSIISRTHSPLTQMVPLGHVFIIEQVGVGSESCGGDLKQIPSIH